MSLVLGLIVVIRTFLVSRWRTGVSKSSALAACLDGVARGRSAGPRLPGWSPRLRLDTDRWLCRGAVTVVAAPRRDSSGWGRPLATVLVMSGPCGRASRRTAAANGDLPTRGESPRGTKKAKNRVRIVLQPAAARGPAWPRPRARGVDVRITIDGDPLDRAAGEAVRRFVQVVFVTASTLSRPTHRPPASMTSSRLGRIGPSPTFLSA